MKHTSNGCLNRNAGRSKTASGIVVYLMEELGDARLRAAQLKQYVAAALELVEKSEKRDHFYEVAANLIHGIPDVLFKLDKSLDAAAMAAARMDYEEIKQGLKPEKAEELERVLEDVRLHYLKRRSSVMNAKEASVCLDKFAQVTATEGRVPTADLARLIANLEQGQKTATSKDPSEFFREAAEYLRSTPNPSRRELVATLRRVLADALVAEDVEAGAGEEFKKVNPDISDAAVEKIDQMHDEHKDVVKDKEASDLEDACWEGYEAYGMKAGEGGQMVPNCVPVKTAANWKVAGWAEKDDAKGHRWMMDGKGKMIDAAHIHEVEGPGMPLYVLKFILKDGTALKDRTTYKKVQDAQKAALKWIKSDSEGASLIFQNFSKLATKESEEKAARFEEGKPADPTENMTPEDAAEWKAMTEEHGDNFKSASVDMDLKTALARLATAKKAVSAVSESEAEKLVASVRKVYKEAHDLFDEAHRTKADYYAPIDPKLVEQLKDLHGEVLQGLSALSRIDSKGADPLLTKDLSTFGHMGLSPDTISEATGLGYVINNKALLVLWKARRAAQQVRFYTNWIESYKDTGHSPSMEDQRKWLRTADAWKA